MKFAQPKYFWQAVLFAVGLEAVLMLIGWWVFSAPQSMDSMVRPTPTIVLGLPSLAQLLAGPHQISIFDVIDMDYVPLFALTIIGTLLYLLTTGFYISLLARTVQERSTSAWREALRAWIPLFLWMVVQAVVGILVSYGVKMLIGLTMYDHYLHVSWIVPPLPILIAALLLLWFRYYFLYMEYALVLLGLSQRKTYRTALALRKANPKPARIFFFGNLLLNLVLSFAINYFFSWPMLVVALLLNALLQTWMQQRLLTHFFREAQALEQSERTN